MKGKEASLGFSRFKVPAVILAVFATFIASVMASFWLLDAAYKREADGRASEYMPVLVLTAGHIEVMANAEVGEYVGAHPDYTFLVPDGQDQALRDQLASWRRGDGVSRTFRVTRHTPGHQSIEVECRGDGAWVGWYEATDKAIVPKYVKLYGPGFIFLVLSVAGLLTGLIWFVGARVWRGARGLSGRYRPV